MRSARAKTLVRLQPCAASSHHVYGPKSTRRLRKLRTRRPAAIGRTPHLACICSAPRASTHCLQRTAGALSARGTQFQLVTCRRSRKQARGVCNACAWHVPRTTTARTQGARAAGSESRRPGTLRIKAQAPELHLARVIIKMCGVDSAEHTSIAFRHGVLAVRVCAKLDQGLFRPRQCGAAARGGAMCTILEHAEPLEPPPWTTTFCDHLGGYSTLEAGDAKLECSKGGVRCSFSSSRHVWLFRAASRVSTGQHHQQRLRRNSGA